MPRGSAPGARDPSGFVSTDHGEQDTLEVSAGGHRSSGRHGSRSPGLLRRQQRFGPGRSRLRSQSWRGVLGVVGLVADVANMMSGKGGSTATGALINAVMGGVAGGMFGTFAHPAAGVALGVAAAIPAGVIGSLIARARLNSN